jgi:hypothetical protein
VLRHLPRSGRRTRAGCTAVAAALTLLASADAGSAQDVEDTGRLAGIDRIATRVDASWDELITMEAGGATEDQFIQALEMTFAQAIAEADAAPGVDESSPDTVACHVDTFYDTGLIIYSFRAQLERVGDDGMPVIVWLRSWVGSFTTQQLHLTFTLGEQCAKSFLEEWRSAN